MNWHNKDAVIAAFNAQDVDFLEKEVAIGYHMSEAAATAVKRFSSYWNLVLRVCRLDKIKSVLLFCQSVTHWINSCFTMP